MTEDLLYRAAHRMREIGGSFAAAIANAYFFADRDNTQRLLGAFGHLFEKYKDENWRTTHE